MDNETDRERKRVPPPNELTYPFPPAMMEHIQALVDEIGDGYPNLTRKQAAQVNRLVELVLSQMTGKAVKVLRLECMREYGFDDYDAFVRICIDGEEA